MPKPKKKKKGEKKRRRKRSGLRFRISLSMGESRKDAELKWKKNPLEELKEGEKMRRRGSLKENRSGNETREAMGI